MTIIARLAGGLGNQLFQYAAARAVALRNDTDLVLDARGFVPRKPFTYDLGHFAISGRVGGEDELPPGRNKPLRYGLWRAFGRSPRFVRENGLGFNPSIANLGPDVYLHGYFQSERYFADVTSTIRKELAIVTEPDAENQRWLEEIDGAGNAVSLHVRRGDYVASAGGQNVYGTCDAAYYARAFAHVRERTGGDATLFVFSDDPDWAEQNLAFDAPMRFARHNGRATAYEDLRLMAACRHHIIANSTFSWWGAWLDPSRDKVVAAPAHWFADSRLNNPDIYPDEWTRIDN